MSGLHKAMAQAFSEIEGATKDANNPHFRTKYADLSSVVAAIKPALVKNGLYFRQMMHEHDRGVCIETVVAHKAGEEISFGKLVVPAGKQDAQGYGSALTYARRYSLMTAFGVCPEDDDGNAATAKPKDETPEMPDHEWSKLVALLKATSTDQGRLMAALKINAPTLRQIGQDDYPRVIDALETKLAKMAKEQSNERAVA